MLSSVEHVDQTVPDQHHRDYHDDDHNDDINEDDNLDAEAR